ncbi:MAG: tRNA (adenosine(37)-N6)-dimethylallyltransferase MiaA [Flavobacteriaceae bacterium]
MKRNVVLIAGPTASGKSAVALSLAETIPAAVINADSMQVYRELSILTARPTPAEEARARHLLYGHIPAAEPYSAGRFTREAAAAVAEARAEGLTPVFAGGTGLYLKSLMQPMSPIPAIDEAVRERQRAAMEADGPAERYRLLTTVDAESAARVSPSDTQRIVRALEVAESTGRTLSQWHEAPKAPPIVTPAEAVNVVLWPDRDRLRERIAARLRMMVAEGALEEAARYRALNLPDELPATRAHGLRALMKVAAGEMDLEAAISGAVDETRQYAKRQFTWYRHQFAEWRRVDPAAEDAAGLIAALLA